MRPQEHTLGGCSYFQGLGRSVDSVWRRARGALGPEPDVSSRAMPHDTRTQTELVENSLKVLSKIWIFAQTNRLISDGPGRHRPPRPPAGARSGRSGGVARPGTQGADCRTPPR